MKKFLQLASLLFVCFIVYFAYQTYPKLDLISGFSAKSVASCHFIDGRNLPSIENGDNAINMIDLAKNSLNDTQKFATAAVYGLKKRKAIYREGLGATLINNSFDVTKPYETPRRNKTTNAIEYPFGNAEPAAFVSENINYNLLKKAINNAFDEKNQKIKNTRAVLVLQNNKIVGEQYAEGFTKNSKLLGWSMTKSITATYFGILQMQNKFDINKPAPIVQWQKDQRAIITTSDLLRMNSGLEWIEDYNSICDATNMLFKDEDMTKSQIFKKAVAPPNLKWNYSSGTTNLLSGILRQQFKTHQEYLDFWYAALIDKIGMNSMLIESDMSGNYVGSSYGWATARDWAKFGTLYLNNGMWNGEQLFDSSWVKYITTPAQGSNQEYGAHFWLNAGKFYKDAPQDMYSCNGYQGQRIFIIPSLQLVIVRLGTSEVFDFNGFLKGILGSLKK
jgi:CubicO group peptidase (beta-lactamase class C family)